MFRKIASWTIIGLCAIVMGLAVWLNSPGLFQTFGILAAFAWFWGTEP